MNAGELTETSAPPGFLARLYNPRPLLQALHVGALAVTSIVGTSMFLPGFMGFQFGAEHCARIGLTVSLIAYIQIRQKPKKAVWWYALAALAPIIISTLTSPGSANAGVVQLSIFYLFASVFISLHHKPLNRARP